MTLVSLLHFGGCSTAWGEPECPEEEQGAPRRKQQTEEK